MPKKSHGLGGGLDSLFQDNAQEVRATQTLRITEIEQNRLQPRKKFDDEAITELAESIQNHGLLQPIVVRPIADGRYQIVAGERRWRAAKLKGNGKSVPALSVIKTPLRDGDTERPDDPAYADSYFVNANSATAPGIVDADRNPILTRGEVYSGVYGRASISFYAFNSNGNKGIACGLNNLQKIRDGEPLGGKASAESDFDTEDDDDFLA